MSTRIQRLERNIAYSQKVRRLKEREPTPGRILASTSASKARLRRKRKAALTALTASGLVSLGVGAVLMDSLKAAVKVTATKSQNALPNQNIKTIEQLLLEYGSMDYGVFGKLPPNLTKILGKTVRRYGVHGDGSCFFHSVCAALRPEYIQETNLQKRQSMGLKFRTDLAGGLTEEKYKKCFLKPNEEINAQEFIKFKSSLAKTSEFAGIDMWQYCMQELDVNIFILRLARDEFHCQQDSSDNFGDKCSQSPILPDRPTVVIANVRDVHYEPVATLESSTMKFLFEKDDRMPTTIRARYPICCPVDGAVAAGECHPYREQEKRELSVSKDMRACQVPPAGSGRYAMEYQAKLCGIRVKNANLEKLAEMISNALKAFGEECTWIEREYGIQPSAARDVVHELGTRDDIRKSVVGVGSCRIESIIQKRFTQKEGRSVFKKKVKTLQNQFDAENPHLTKIPNLEEGIIFLLDTLYPSERKEHPERASNLIAYRRGWTLDQWVEEIVCPVVK